MQDSVSSIPGQADLMIEEACQVQAWITLFFTETSAVYERPEPDVGFGGGWECEARMIGGEIFSDIGEPFILTREQVISLIGEEVCKSRENDAAYQMAEKRTYD